MSSVVLEQHSCKMLEEFKKDVWQPSMGIIKRTDLHQKQIWSFIFYGMADVEIKFCPFCGIKLDGEKKID